MPTSADDDVDAADENFHNNMNEAAYEAANKIQTERMAKMKAEQEKARKDLDMKFARIPKLKANSKIESETGQEIFCVKYSPDGKLVAASTGDGSINVYNASTRKLTYTLNEPGPGNTVKLPACCIRWRPLSTTSKTQNVLLSAGADGTVCHYHVTSLKRFHVITETENEVYALDYLNDGSKFATAGKDYTVRIYDEATKTQTSALCGGWGKNFCGHSNRVFSVKFHPDDPNIVLSGGWDNTLQVWDLRTDSAVRDLYGPHICGDAIDIKGDTIVTGSWQANNQLQTWDLKSCELIENIPWVNPMGTESSMLYAAQFSKDPEARFIAAGGGGTNEARLFNRQTLQCLGSIGIGKRGVYSMDFSPINGDLAIAAGDGSIHFLDTNSLAK